MARSVVLELGQEEDESGNIWSSDRVGNATEGDIADYITDRINDYDQKELKGVNLFEYWRSDFENFTSAAYKKNINHETNAIAPVWTDKDHGQASQTECRNVGDIHQGR
jgi:hypothetical protein